ncbi:hypothetical protein ACB092_09G132800 [Castanea dentata]
MEFEANEIAYDFFNEYGRKAGFSIRKERLRDQNIKIPRAETRCGCEARLVIILNRDSKKYVVNEFIAEHNHYLQLASTVHMMPSQRKVAVTHAIEIDLAHESRLRLKQSYKLLSKQVGGYYNLGFTKQDHKNYLRIKQQRDMEHGEAASLGRYFSQLITNIFWADVRMIIDYSHCGDVITFDTTETIVFGGALLYDQTIESFVWLFKTFLEAMSEKKPITIFTDQDEAMSAAIKVVMPKTYRALCTCIYKYDGKDEFLTAWNEMLDKYDKDCLRIDPNIVEFFTHFERVVNQKWNKKLEVEYNSRHKFPRLKLKSSHMLNQVATVYTPTLFDLFQIEVEEVMVLSIVERNVSQTHSYVVGVFNEYGKYEVMWNPLDETLSCSCRKFESFGILCRHGLKVLDVLDIKLIPNRYIMKRWRRDTKDGSGKNCTTHNIKPDTRLEYVDWYRDLCPKYIQLVNEACEIKEGYNILSLAIADLKKKKKKTL